MFALRFCRNTYAKSYKPTIGVDFEMERFEILGVPFSLQLWDTAGQERFKCVASTYYRGAQAIIVVFDLSNYNSLDNARQWLEDAMIDNDPSSVLLFLVGTKKDQSKLQIWIMTKHQITNRRTAVTKRPEKRSVCVQDRDRDPDQHHVTPDWNRTHSPALLNRVTL
ncbi:Ras-related protein Rab-34 [Bagarius yarrelli]|uniref:Ras-related protein Rab-34 n=1 Tax=Bagarius yarrelli TaxID=175774 RepID=A0A556TX17_BAGYA|nr:Ras-related protein Rab-34 [Bagarius yarrelli]